MNLRTEHLARFIQILESSFAYVRSAPVNSIDYDMYRNATIKGFELTLETAVKLLRKTIKSYVGSPRAIDELDFKDLFRLAAKHGLIEAAAVTKWFKYWGNRNDIAHDYGVGFAEETLTLVPEFITDARAIEHTLTEKLFRDDA